MPINPTLGPLPEMPQQDNKKPSAPTDGGPSKSQQPEVSIAGVTDPKNIDALMGPLPPSSPEELDPNAGKATTAEKLLMMGSVIAYAIGGNPQAAQNTVLMFQKQLAAEKQAAADQWDRLMQIATEKRLRVARLQAGVTEGRQLADAAGNTPLTPSEDLAERRFQYQQERDAKKDALDRQEAAEARRDKAEAKYTTAIHQTRMEAEAAITRHKGIDISGLGQSLARTGILENLRMSVLGLGELTQSPEELKQALTNGIAAAIELNNEAFVEEVVDPETNQIVKVNMTAQNLAKDFAGIMMRQASTLVDHPEQLDRYIKLMSDDLAWPSSSDISVGRAKAIIANSELAKTEPLTPEEILPTVTAAGNAMRNALKGDLAVDYEEWRNMAVILQAVALQETGMVDQKGQPVMELSAANIQTLLPMFEKEIEISLLDLQSEGLIQTNEDRDYYGNAISEAVQRFLTDGQIPSNPLFYASMTAAERAFIPSPQMRKEQEAEKKARKESFKRSADRPGIMGKF